MRTDFEIANIRISVESLYELNDEKGYSLYRIDSVKREATDTTKDLFLIYAGNVNKEYFKIGKVSKYYEIRTREDIDFPKPEGVVLFQNEMNLYLKTRDGSVVHFFRIPLSKHISAWCETTGKKSLTIHYRPEARAYFERAVGCFNAAAFENIMYVFGKFLFHCSYVDVGGEAVLFSARSGGGKTTHALLWEQCGIGEMINGDRAILERVEYDDSEARDSSDHRKEETEANGKREECHRPKYMVHGLPIAGSSNVFKNRSLPLRAIFMLEKAPVNEVVEIPPSKRFLQVIEQITIHTWDKEFVSTATDFAANLIQNVPVKLLRCRPDEGAVRTVREALSLMC